MFLQTAGTMQLIKEEIMLQEIQLLPVRVTTHYIKRPFINYVTQFYKILDTLSTPHNTFIT
jgi:hypothetical protein